YEDSLAITNSDYKIFVSKWSFPFALSRKLRNKANTKRRIFNYKKMTTELWQKFTDQTSSNLLINNTLFSIQTTESLETTWHKIQTSIMQAALSKIPNKKFATKNFHHTFSSKATELYLDLKLLGEAIKNVKRYLDNPSILYPDLSTIIHNINSRHSFNIPLL